MWMSARSTHLHCQVVLSLGRAGPAPASSSPPPWTPAAHAAPQESLLLRHTAVAGWTPVMHPKERKIHSN